MTKKISQLTEADALDGTEFTEIVQGGESVKASTQAIADLAAGGPGGGLSNPWGLFANASASVQDEFDGNPLSWTDVASSSGGGSATWQEGNDALSVIFSGQSGNKFQYHLTPATLDVGESVEVSMTRWGYPSNFNGPALVLTNGTSGSSDVLALIALSSVTFRDGTIDGLNSGSLYGLVLPSRTRYRIRRTATSTWAAEFSYDGVQWHDFSVSAFSKSFTPTHIGIGVSAYGDSGTFGATIDYIRTY